MTNGGKPHSIPQQVNGYGLSQDLLEPRRYMPLSSGKIFDMYMLHAYEADDALYLATSLEVQARTMPDGEACRRDMRSLGRAFKEVIRDD